MHCCSLVDTSVVGTRSARELAALGPGTMLCDGNAYIFTFLAAASEVSHPAPSVSDQMGLPGCQLNALPCFTPFQIAHPPFHIHFWDWMLSTILHEHCMY